MKYFVTATGTDSGKTLVSALLCRALKATYWKPIQAGRPTDSDQMRSWLGEALRVLPEACVLERAASPHAAAAAQGKYISLGELPSLPPVSPLVVEGAGGLLVPLNEREFIIDLISQLRAEVILVVNTYLGCINHALLSAEALRSRKISVRGIVFNGPSMPESESIILKHSSYSCLLRIPQLQQVRTADIEKYAALLQTALTKSKSNLEHFEK